MTDYAIHSPNDGELLIRFHDELVKHGFVSDEGNIYENPNEMNYRAKKKNRDVWYYTLRIYDDMDILYLNHGSANCIHQDLTPENFNSVLNEVLQNFGINV